jgi:hypothetical protein
MLKLHLITTTRAKDTDGEHIAKLLQSVRKAAGEVDGLAELHHSILFQGCDGAPPSIKSSANIDFSSYSTPELLSLSAARNVVLRKLLTAGTFDDNSIVCFPDDDCWYPDITLRTIAQCFLVGGGLDFWFCRYGSTASPLKEVGPVGKEASARDIICNASSNTVFFRGSVINQVRYFDEQLGLGAPNSGGEDLDYALAAFRYSRKAVYVNCMAIGHRDKDRFLRHKYYRGSLIAIAKHSLVIGGLMPELLRKLAIGCYLVVTGKMPALTYVSSVQIALGACNQKRAKRSWRAR